jgi:hypothetical protein
MPLNHPRALKNKATKNKKKIPQFLIFHRRFCFFSLTHSTNGKNGWQWAMTVRK